MAEVLGGAKIKLKRCLATGNEPLAKDLEQGEIAINVADGVIFVKRVVGGVESVEKYYPDSVHPAVTVDNNAGLSQDGQFITIQTATSTRPGVLSETDFKAFSDKVSSQFDTVQDGVNLPTGNLGVGVSAPGAKISLPEATGAAGGIAFGSDINLYRSAADVLKTDDCFAAAQFRVNSLNTAPASSTALGALGEIRITADYIYVCTGMNTWKRAALSTF